MDKPFMTGCAGQYYWARTKEFHRTFKREFYGWYYGSHECQLIHNDFYSMYDMGGEL